MTSERCSATSTGNKIKNTIPCESTGYYIMKYTLEFDNTNDILGSGEELTITIPNI